MNYLTLLIVFVLLSSYQIVNKKLVTRSKLDHLTNTATMYQVDKLLFEDSVVKINSRNAFVSFAKAGLPGNVCFDRDANTKPAMIADDAQINRFWINFDSSSHV